MRAEMTVLLWKPGKSVSTVAKVTVADQGRYRIEYEAPPEARGRIMISDGKHRMQIEPGSKAVIGAPLPTFAELMSTETAKLIEANYDIRLVSDSEQTSARDCFLLEFASKYAGRGSQRRWIDRETYRTLRVETKIANGTLERVVGYRNVEFPTSIPASTFKIPMASKKVVLREPSDAVADPAQLKKLAANANLAMQTNNGFRLIQANMHKSTPRADQQFVYSDGIAMVSVFVAQDGELPDRAAQDWRPVTLTSQRAFLNTSGHANALIWVDSGRRYTVVSHLQAGALTALAATLEARH
jgi:outer membrane lipoprotein-sorting protein